MFKRFVVIFCTLGVLSTEFVFAQDPEFSQFYANPLYLNPAFAGAARCPRFILNYRNQWPGITGTFVTYAASYDQHVDAISGGIGISFWNDKAGEGIYSTTHISGMYAYQLNVTRSFSIKAGFQVTWAQKKLDWTRLNFGDQIDNKRGFVFNTLEQQNWLKRSYPDFSAGILGYSKRFFAGFAMHHITEPDEAFLISGKLPTKFTGHVGALLPLDGIGGETSLSPNILYMKQQDFQQILLGLYLNKGPIVGGIWYRGVLKKKNDAFILLLGFQQGLVKLGYSYDITISKLASATAGAHELSFTITLECKPKRRKFRTISCPSF